LGEIRRARILESVSKAGFVAVSDLADELGVSTMTIRRDIALMEGQGRFLRTHGGAISAERGGWGPVWDEDEPAFDRRMRRNAQAKATIARAAARLIGPSESIGLDVGTSVLALAREICSRDDLRIFTNNLRAGMELATSGSSIYVVGGKIRQGEFSLIGSAAVDQFLSHFIDRVFVGVSGIDESGTFDYSPEDTEVKRAMIRNAGSVVVLCDSAKFGRRALARVADFSRIDVLVTDAAPSDELAQALAEHGVDVIVAE
ncbi:MAG: DeoR/GlpR family DNA-binding transcription regulator, partial [Mesorhizobium sp.]